MHQICIRHNLHVNSIQNLVDPDTVCHVCLALHRKTSGKVMLRSRAFKSTFLIPTCKQHDRER